MIKVILKIRALLIIAFLISNTTQAQELKTSILLSPESKEYSDLYFLNSELKDKRLLMLGEMTHMYGNIFEMKARLVEYLHKELGYTTLAMESSMYDIWLMNKNGFNPKDFNDAIWSVWSSTEEFQRLVKYIENNNIKVIGFDSQFNKNISNFVEAFFEYLNNNNIKLKLNEDDFAIVIEDALEIVQYDETDIKFLNFQNELNRIIKIISQFESTEQNYYWLQFSKNILACAKDAYYNKDEKLSSSFISSHDNIRDAQMADNLITYMNYFPKEKIICWADNIHLMNNSVNLGAIENNFVSMGTHLKKALKNQVYSLATLHANDSLLDQKKWHSTPIIKGSIEHKLNFLNTPYLFFSSNQKSLSKPIKTRLLDFVEFTELKLNELHDGYIFFKHAKIPKNEFQELTTKDSNVIINKNKLVNQKPTKLLKGQIIEFGTGTPIPYANIIIENNEVYRISDEEGNFELQITDDMLENSFVSIYSMGYEKLTIPLNKLTTKVTMIPNFEELDEVIVTARLLPKSILKETIKRKKSNYPTEPFNYYRYGRIIQNMNDSTLLNLEIITKEYDEGYNQDNIPTNKVEQIKWNKNLLKHTPKFSSDFFHFRQNAIQYATILHSRKYKKFNLKLISSNKPEHDNLYIIDFVCERNKWNFTNIAYPTKYSGTLYINKKDYAIIKIVQNWETTLLNSEIEKYKAWLGLDQTKKAKLKNIKIKKESICTFSKHENEKYYASNYYYRSYSDRTDYKERLTNSVYESTSNIFDIDTSKNVEAIDYEYHKKKLTVLDRISYNSEFWNSFYLKKIK